MRGPLWWHSVVAVAAAECAATRAVLGLAPVLGVAVLLPGFHAGVLRGLAALTLLCIAAQVVLHRRTNVLRTRALTAQPVRHFDYESNRYI